VGKSISGFAFPTNSSANAPVPAPILGRREFAADKSPPRWHFVGSLTRTHAQRL